MLFILIISTVTLGDKKMPTPPNIKAFLEKIEQIESSGGQNTNHPVITAPNAQQGTSAIGRYGLMPNTIKELVNRRRLRGTASPDMIELSQLPPDQIKAKVEASPDLEDQFANDLANHVIRKQGGDEDKAAYSWLQGRNLQPDDITPEQLNSSDYVNKFRRLGPMINNFSGDDDSSQ